MRGRKELKKFSFINPVFFPGKGYFLHSAYNRTFFFSTGLYPEFAYSGCPKRIEN